MWEGNLFKYSWSSIWNKSIDTIFFKFNIQSLFLKANKPTEKPTEKPTKPTEPTKEPTKKGDKDKDDKDGDPGSVTPPKSFISNEEKSFDSLSRMIPNRFLMNAWK